MIDLTHTIWDVSQEVKGSISRSVAGPDRDVILNALDAHTALYAAAVEVGNEIRHVPRITTIDRFR